jgi:hypothetical protein
MAHGFRTLYAKADDPNLRRAGMYFEIKRNGTTKAWAQFQFRSMSSSVQLLCAYYIQEGEKRVFVKSPDTKLVEFFDRYLSIIKNKLAGEHWAKSLNDFNKDHEYSTATMGNAYKDSEAKSLIESQRGYRSKNFFHPTLSSGDRGKTPFSENYGDVKLSPPITIDKLSTLNNLKTHSTDMRYLPIEILKSCEFDLESISQKNLDEIVQHGFTEDQAKSLQKAAYNSMLYRGKMSDSGAPKNYDQDYLEKKLYVNNEVDEFKRIVRSEYSFGFTTTTAANSKLIDESQGFILKDSRQHAIWIRSSAIIEAPKGKPFKVGLQDLADIFNSLNIWKLPEKSTEDEGKGFMDSLISKIDSKNHHLTTICPWPQIYIKKDSNIIVKYRTYLPLNNYQIFIYPMSVRKDVDKGVISYSYHKEERDSVRVKKPFNDYISNGPSWDGMYGMSAQFGSLPDGVYMVGVANTKRPNAPSVGSIFQVGRTSPESGLTPIYCF